MSKSIVASLVLASQALAAGIAAGAFRITLIDAGGTEVAKQDTDEPTVTFESIPAGDYTISALRLDTAGNPISTPVSASVSVPADLAQVDVPVSITVSLV
jgi:hypothetical protein